MKECWEFKIMRGCLGLIEGVAHQVDDMFFKFENLAGVIREI